MKRRVLLRLARSRSRTLRIALWIGIAISANLLTMRVLARDAEARPYYSTARPGAMVIAHMGGDGIWPGNTLYAYHHADKLGVDAFDMDVHITKDGTIILMHDETVTRTTNEREGIAVEEMTAAEIKRLDAAYNWSPDGGKSFPFRGRGITVPTLEEVFQTFPDKRYLIEIKLSSNFFSKTLCDLIHKYNLQDRLVVASFLDGVMADFRATCPNVATSASFTEIATFVALNKVGLSGLISPEYQSLHVPFETSESFGINIMTESFVRAAHAKNIKVEVWTVDDPELMQRYMAWGVDGIDTDRPDLMVKLQRQQQQQQQLLQRPPPHPPQEAANRPTLGES